MKKYTKLLISLLLVLSMCCLISCSKSTTATEAKSEVNDNTKEFKIGTLQLVQHAALDASYKGFVDYLDEKGIKFSMDFQNASGEQSACATIAEKFANDNLDLVYAIATPAAQSVLAQVTDVPIVASAVTDPAGSGLCASNENPGGMLTAASDLTPIEAQFDLLKELLPDAKNVGILYCSAESNSKIQADMAMAAANKRGLIPSEYTVVSSTDIQTVVESMVGKVDVIYIPTDNVMAAGMDTVSTITNENKIPTIVGEEGMVDKGGFATYGIDYYQLGRIAGQIAEEILVNGKNPGDIPVRYLDSASCQRKINTEVAEILGISVK